MVLFLAALGLTLFFGGVVAVLCDPPKNTHKLIALVIFSGVVLIGGAAYAAYVEEAYRKSQQGVWVSFDEVETKPPVKIGDKWYKIVLMETTEPEEGSSD